MLSVCVAFAELEFLLLCITITAYHRTMLAVKIMTEIIDTITNTVLITIITIMTVSTIIIMINYHHCRHHQHHHNHHHNHYHHDSKTYLKQKFTHTIYIYIYK